MRTCAPVHHLCSVVLLPGPFYSVIGGVYDERNIKQSAIVVAIMAIPTKIILICCHPY